MPLGAKVRAGAANANPTCIYFGDFVNLPGRHPPHFYHHITHTPTCVCVCLFVCFSVGLQLLVVIVTCEVPSSDTNEVAAISFKAN